MAARDHDQGTDLSGSTATVASAAALAAVRIHPAIAPPGIFSCLSHIVAYLMQQHAAQSRIRSEHVDNLAERVKFAAPRMNADE
jgi:hypothetical protein